MAYYLQVVTITERPVWDNGGQQQLLILDCVLFCSLPQVKVMAEEVNKIIIIKT